MSALAVAAPANAAFPGTNGKINFSNSSGYRFMSPDGSSVTPAHRGGVWSPDGTRVLFECSHGYFCIERADGTIEGDDAFGGDLHGLNWSPDGAYIVAGTQYCGADVCDPARIVYSGYTVGGGATVTTQDDIEPAWSPDGSKLAFITYRDDPNRQLYLPDGPGCFPCNTELYVSNLDGSGQVRLTNSAGSEGSAILGIDDDIQELPSWSPDGTRIAFASTRDDPTPDSCGSSCRSEIYVINADGTGTRRLTNSGGRNTKPVWSPDKTKIAFQTDRDGNREIYSMNPDGSAQTNLTNDSYDNVLYDWLAAARGYPRPKGATPLQTYLTVAYAECTSPNSTHAGPLSYGSCVPPGPASGTLTVGTPDSNGQRSNGIGKVFYAAGPGDLGITVAISDVRNRSDLSGSPTRTTTRRAASGPAPSRTSRSRPRCPAALPPTRRSARAAACRRR